MCNERPIQNYVRRVGYHITSMFLAKDTGMMLKVGGIWMCLEQWLDKNEDDSGGELVDEEECYVIDFIQDW